MSNSFSGLVMKAGIVGACVSASMCAFAMVDDATALAKAREILAKMTLEEKASFAGGNGSMTLNAVPRVGIDKEWYFSDSSHTVRTDIQRGGFAHEKIETSATVLPTLSALAATWNTSLATEFGHVIGEEARSRGKDQMLGPGVNIMRTPLCGRNWEYMSEDTCLTAKLVVPEIRAMQSHDVAACVKHFALNGQELARNSVDTIVDERTLNEIYLPAFRAAVKEAGSLTLMTAYNKYNGQFMSENAYMLRGILRDRWGFLGQIVTDWGGQHSCALAANNGCGIEMNSGNAIRYLRNNKLGTLPLAEAVKAGEVPPAVLDEMTLRVLYVMAKVNFFDEAKRAPGSRNTPEHQAAARRIGEEAVVLLKNERGLLPLEASRTKRILLVGNLADTEHCRHGWSAEGLPPYEITPAKGIEEYFAKRGQKIVLERMPLATGDYQAQMHAIDDKHITTFDLKVQDAGMSVKAWNVDLCRAEDAAKSIGRAYTRTVGTGSAKGMMREAIAADTNANYIVRFSTKIVAPESGRYIFSLLVGGNARFKGALAVGGKGIVTSSELKPLDNGSVEMAAGKEYDAVVEIATEGRRLAATECELKWLMPSEQGTEEDLRKRAQAADAVIVFTGTKVGHGRALECEGADRPNMKNPEGMDEAVAKILAWKLDNVVVVNHSGAPVELPWVDECPTLLQEPYLGQEAGRVLAKVLFGDVNPSGKLPCTWPKRYEDTAVATLGTYNEQCATLNERFYVGYRWFDKRGIEPMFHFGHGLSYTKFEYGETKAAIVDGGIEVSVRVTNVGKKRGRETVQVYVAYPESKVERCVKDLKGFDKVELEPNETKVAKIKLNLRDLAYFDTFTKRFTTEAGRYEILVGASSADLRGKTEVTIGKNSIFAD